jgi:hypothetical protein
MAESVETHGVIITHGIGDKIKPGDLLADFSNYLADGLLQSPEVDEKGNKIYPEILREAELSGGIPSVTLHIKSPDRKKEFRWICKEAFWGDAFPPPKASTVIWWLLTKNLFHQLEYAYQGIFKDPANDRTFIPEEDREKEIKKHLQVTQWTAAKEEKTSYTKLVTKSSLTMIVLFPVAILAYIVLALVWICQFLPAIGPLEEVLKWVHKLDPFLSNSLGDAQKYIVHGVWSANARGRLENIVAAMYNDEYGSVRDITLIAHSMGCVVAYDAMAEGSTLAEKIEELQSKGKKKKITFISVGSGINQLFQVARKSNLYSQSRFKLPLASVITGIKDISKQTSQKPEDEFYWLDIYARRDPVPAGGVDKAVITQARVDPERQVKRRKIINKDNIALDHSAYWSNTELFTPRVARAINGGTDYPWPEAGITPEKLARRTREAARLTLLVRVAGAVIIVGGIVAACLWGTGAI